MIIPPAIIPIGPPSTIIAIPAPVVAALVVPAITTSFFFLYLFSIIFYSFSSSPIEFDVVIFASTMHWSVSNFSSFTYSDSEE